ncbi:cyclin-T1-4-like isoform X2 [Salvia miltiorrhiza]|uniref:cyclin-T1-4-like isoform X2 n=1 Tax=Salvia miltiorrhiza TaxID=226208 RepID=UPI0025AD2B2E|nr:cyclin-T1-4-like isoform X2 [Salvia miltiorrhiza]
MSLARPHRPRDGHFRSDGRSSYGRMRTTAAANYEWSHDRPSDSNFYTKNHGSSCDFSRDFMLDRPKYEHVWPDVVPPSKRRKVLDFSHESTGRPYQQSLSHENGLENLAGIWQHVPPLYATAYCSVPSVCNNSSAATAGTRPDDASTYSSTTSKRDRSKYEDDEEVVFMSRDEIERCSPSRKDGIDLMHETHLRYSYCAFLQNLGVRLDLPQTTIGTAMVVCHRFFVRRSHASHDRFLIATAALFLASKSEETPRPLNDVLKVSCETFHKQDFIVLSHTFPVDWFEQYRERIIDAEQLILTTLNFELGVQHPYESLTSTLEKLGFSQSILVNLALSLVSEGVYRGLACSPYDINSWRLMCCSSNVLFFI